MRFPNFYFQNFSKNSNFSKVLKIHYFVSESRLNDDAAPILVQFGVFDQNAHFLVKNTVFSKISAPSAPKFGAPLAQIFRLFGVRTPLAPNLSGNGPD